MQDLASHTGGDGALAQEADQGLAALLEYLGCVHCGMRRESAVRSLGRNGSVTETGLVVEERDSGRCTADLR